MRIFIDEAWRGPLAGPLYVGLILESDQFEFQEIDEHFRDSKMLSAKKREESYQLLMGMVSQGLVASTGRATRAEIDAFWVTRAINMAILRGLYQIYCQLKRIKNKGKNQTFGEVEFLIWEWMRDAKLILMIDGKMDFWLRKTLNIEVETMVKGDAKVRWIAMASILAKVERDRIMIELSKQFWDRGLAKHKGYWTKSHYEKIKIFWVSSQHRKLFLKKIFPEWKIQNFDSSLLFKEKPPF